MRTYLLSMAVSLLAFAFFSLGLELAAAKADKPNIVLLFADDVRETHAVFFT